MNRFPVAALITILLVAPGASVATAGSVLDRVKERKVVRCGGAPRPGLLSFGEDGQVSGLLPDLCRAIAAGVLGPEGRVAFHAYEAPGDFDAVRDGGDDVFFLDGSDILGPQHLAPALLPGPPVFFEQSAVMVRDTSPVRHVADLAGQPICFSQGTDASRHLEAWFSAHQLAFTRMGYQEDVELLDAYNVQVCPAMAAEGTTLAAARLDRGVNDVHSRILPEPLAITPILAATGTQDAAWASVVAWTVLTLLGAETPAGPWRSGGLASFPLDGASVGLDPGWQQRVVAGGTYGDLYRRNLGTGSPLGMARGPNSLWQDGGLFVLPTAD